MLNTMSSFSTRRLKHPQSVKHQRASSNYNVNWVVLPLDTYSLDFSTNFCIAGPVVDLLDIVKRLLQLLHPGVDDVSGLPPALFVAFDEAHTILSTTTTGGVQWTQFSSLHWAFRVLRSYPVWSIFLSTTGKLEQFAPIPMLDDSNRIVEGSLITPTPFSTLGFDILADRLNGSMSHSLDYVSSMEYKVSLGRPL